MLPTWATDVLKSNGLAGVFILVLIMAIAFVVRILTGMLRERDKQIQVMHEQRAQERETLVRLLEGANTAQRMTAEVTARRVEVMTEQSSAIIGLANANDRLGDKIVNQTEVTKEKLGDIKHVIDATGESYRVLNGIVTEIRNGLSNLVSRTDAIDRKIGN